MEAHESEIYDGEVLFHGPRFQMLRRVDGVGDEGSSGEMVGTRALGWTGSGWQTDAGAMDGGLQLALLWSRHVLGGRSLPTAVGSYTGYGDPLPEEPVHCQLRRKTVSSSSAVCDLTFSVEGGPVFAELTGVETHLIPGTN